MKLVSKNILINTVISIIILFIGEYSIYAFLQYKTNKEMTEHLYIEKHIMLNSLQKGVDIEFYNHNLGDDIEITQIKNLVFTKPVFEDILDTVEVEGEEKFTSKKITFDCSQAGKNYRVSITKTIDEDEGVTESIPMIMLISGLSMLALLVLVNVYVYSQLFSPVNQLIKDIEQFSIHDLKKIEQVKTGTYEFYVLGQKISAMSQKIIDDYKSMKEFTENMAHEVQTPLAVINSKLEQCVQDKNLSATQAGLLGDAMRAVQKLFKLNRGLIILSKLENRQYLYHETINMSQLVHSRLDYFLDFLTNKHITVSEMYNQDIYASIDTALSEIMIDNILKNAIKHNFDKGELIIKTEPGVLIVSNTGPAPKVPTEDFFNRFYSGNTNESLGLGLSIVKKICEYNGFVISYQYEDGLHHIKIVFSPS